jgi:TetR/AcrR family transcriptional repressor of nem operon
MAEMARPREFDEDAVLDAAVQCFWHRGYESTSVRDLVQETGLTAASLYNAFGEKRLFFRTALDRYVATSIRARIERCEALPPREAIEAFFGDILRRSLADRDYKGCLVVNAALEVAPHDAEFRKAIASVLRRLELFFLTCVRRGQDDGSISPDMPAASHAKHLLGVLMGVRVLSRVRPEKALLEGIVSIALTTLGRPLA